MVVHRIWKSGTTRDTEHWVPNRELKNQEEWIYGLVSPTTTFIIIPIPDRNRLPCNTRGI